MIKHSNSSHRSTHYYYYYSVNFVLHSALINSKSNSNFSFLAMFLKSCSCVSERTPAGPTVMFKSILDPAGPLNTRPYPLLSIGSEQLLDSESASLHSYAQKKSTKVSIPMQNLHRLVISNFKSFTNKLWQLDISQNGVTKMNTGAKMNTGHGTAAQQMTEWMNVIWISQ